MWPVFCRDRAVVPGLPAFVLAASTFPVTKTIFAAVNLEGKPFNQSVCKFGSCAVIDLLYCGACNLHIYAAIFLRKAFSVNQSNRFVFIDR